MTTHTEGNLRITFPGAMNVRKFDRLESHGLTHCMKAVDFTAEDDDRVLFIEFKDPGHPRARDEAREEFVERFRSGRLDEDLKYKYRDSFLYEWASGNAGKPVYLWVLIAIDRLTDTELLARTDDLKRKLPLRGPRSEAWPQPICAGCMIFDIRTWNRNLPLFPILRVDRDG